MNKKFAEELMSAYLDGEVTPAEQTQVERELAENPERQRLLEELRAMRAELQAAPVHRAPAGFADRVLREARRAQSIAPEKIATDEAIARVEHAAVIAASGNWNRRFALWGTVALAASLTAVLCYSQWNDPRGVAQRDELSVGQTSADPLPDQRFKGVAASTSTSRTSTDRGESKLAEEFANADAAKPFGSDGESSAQSGAAEGVSDYAYDALGSQSASTSKAGKELFDHLGESRHDERESLERRQSIDERGSNRFSESDAELESFDRRVEQRAGGSPAAVRMGMARSSEAGETGANFYQAPQDFQKLRAIDGVSAPANVFYRIARGSENVAEGRGAEVALEMQMGFGGARSADFDRPAGRGGAVRFAEKEATTAPVEDLSKVLPKEAAPEPAPGLEAANPAGDFGGKPAAVSRAESRAEQPQGSRQLGRSLAAGGNGGGAGGGMAGSGGALGDRLSMQAGEAATRFNDQLDRIEALNGQAAQEQAGGMPGEPISPVRTYYMDVTADAYAQGAVEKLLVENGIAQQNSLDLVNAVVYPRESLFGRVGEGFAVEEQVASDEGPVDSEHDSPGQAESELSESHLAAGLEAPSDLPSPAPEGEPMAENSPAAAIELSAADSKSPSGATLEQVYVVLATRESLQTALEKFRETPGIAIEEANEPTRDQQQLVQDVANLHLAFSVMQSEQTEKLAELRVVEARPEGAPAKKESLTDDMAMVPAAALPAASEPAASGPAVTEPAAAAAPAAPTATTETAAPEKLAQRRAAADAAKPVVPPPPAPANGEGAEEVAKDSYRGISPRAARPGGGSAPAAAPAAESAVENAPSPGRSRSAKASSAPRQVAAVDASSSPESTPETPLNREESAEVKQLGERDKTNSWSLDVAGKRDGAAPLREQVLIVVRVAEAANRINEDKAGATPADAAPQPTAPPSTP